MKIIDEKNINLMIVKQGDTIEIEKDISIHILWPNEKKSITKNLLNNNSIVCKIYYKDFSMLFTGDIEKEAESALLKSLENHTEIFATDILKVAHHGSNTSSTENFIKKLHPQFALIGVGENNKFGHPNDEIITRLEKYGTEIYRTDKMGEISLRIDENGKIRIKKFIENRRNYYGEFRNRKRTNK